MVKEICDSFRFDDDSFHLQESNTRYITYEYRTDVVNDRKVIELINELLSREQKRCDNCIHYQRGGYFCGYRPAFCDIYGNIEFVDHPHYDGDGSKCEKYECKKELN